MSDGLVVDTADPVAAEPLARIYGEPMVQMPL